MSSGILLLHLFLWSFSTSISNVHTNPSTLVPAELSVSPRDTLDALASTRAELPRDFPSNIIVQPELRASVSRLWAGSPTFRAQGKTIGTHRFYRVAVMLDPTLTIDRKARARCVIRVYSSGLVMARVTVPTQRDLEELIPHELEHVIEHIDGIDVRRNVGKYGAGTYEAGQGQIETMRAVHAGRQARDELVWGRNSVAALTRR